MNPLDIIQYTALVLLVFLTWRLVLLTRQQKEQE